MPPKSLDRKDEQRLLDAVKTATSLVEDGLSPDAAVEKVARDSGFGPGEIRLLGHAFNTGRQVSQWKEPGGILDKLAEFPLCDPDVVVGNVYGRQPTKEAAQVVDSCYNRPPVADAPPLSKAASYKIPSNPPKPYAPDPAEALDVAYGKIQRAKQAAEEGRRLVSAETDRLRATVAGLVGYFKQASYNRLPFATVEHAARAYCGPDASRLLDVVYAQARIKEARAGDACPVFKTPVDTAAYPFPAIKSAVDAGVAIARLRADAEALTKKAEAAKTEELRPFTGAGKPQRPAAGTTEKAAVGWLSEVGAIATGDILAHKATHPEVEEDPYGDVEALDAGLNSIRAQAGRRRLVKAAFLNTPAVGAAVGTMLGRTIGSVPKSKDDMVDDAWMELEDPEHYNELRKIRAHATLSQLLTDPDDPISGHDPHKVLNAYNEIAAATPRVAENVATLRPILRKRLESHQEPFEAKEMLDIEKGLAASKLPTPNTSIMSESPEKLLG